MLPSAAFEHPHTFHRLDVRGNARLPSPKKRSNYVKYDECRPHTPIQEADYSAIHPLPY